MRLKFIAETLARWTFPDGRTVFANSEFNCKIEDAQYLMNAFPRDFKPVKEFQTESNKMYAKSPTQYKSK